ncbi:MAG TPA: DinB family protein [Bacteroidia bacterium]
MITHLEAFKDELEREAIGTRKMLALVPTGKMDWAPHEKSMKMKALATHIADLPTWISLGLTTDELDFNTAPYNPADCKNGKELVDYFNKNVDIALKDLKEAKEDILEEDWTLRAGETIYAKHSKLVTVRHAYAQMTHHRAQLGVYLRLLNIPIPGVYGPSADEQQI